MSTVKAVHLAQEGVYLLEGLWGGDSYEVDGLKLPTGNAVVQDITRVVRVVESGGPLLHYADEAGHTQTQGDYADKLAELTGGAAHDDDGDWVFNDLDAEFEYRKFVKRWRAVFGPKVIERMPVEVEIVEVRTSSGDPEIVSLWNATSVHHDRRLYQMMRDGIAARTLRELCAAAELPFDIPSHSGLRFAKIDEAFAFDDSFDFKGRPFIGTLEQCKAEKTRVAGSVERVVRVHAAKKAGTPLRGVAQVLLDLRRVQVNLSGVRSKSDSSAPLGAARKAVAELIDGLEKQV